MKKPSKKLITAIVSVFCVVFFAGIVAVMATTGKIDLSGVPGVGAALDKLASAQEGNSDAGDGELTAEVSNQVYRVADSVTPAGDYTSINDVEVAADGSIFATDETGKKLYKLGADGSILNTFNSESKVNGVCLGSNAVYLLHGELAGTVTVLNPSNLAVTATIEVGHTPTAMVINGTTGYVANRFDNTVSVINLSTNTVTSTIDIDGREPVAMTIASGKIFVACHLPDDSSVNDVISSNVAVINLSTNSVEKTIELVNGAGGVKDITSSPDGKTVYVSHVIARYAYPTTQLDRGWINTNGFSIINAETNVATTAVMLDQLELGAANPWGIDVSDDGSKLVCNISGTDEVIVVDIAKMNAKIDAVYAGTGVVSSVSKIVDYLPFLDGCRERLTLTGKGARAIDIDGDTAYIGLYFDGSIDKLNLTDNTVSNISFVTQPDADEVRTGQILFSDANNCYQKWESCLSCHPDALADGFNWDNLNDGLGNPKSAKSMLYSHRTPPVMATGIRATAEIAVRAGMKYIQFNVLPEESMAYIDEYLKSLQPAESPYLDRDGTLSESAERGKELFESVGCAECHPAPLYTDLKMHDVGTNDTSVNWEYREFVTPTLVEVWRTGPWLHDGQYNNMEDVVRKFAKNLTDAEITDLTNFVMSIGDSGEQYGVEQIFVDSTAGTAINSISPGGNITSLSVRRQKTDAPASARVTVTLKAADGTEIKSVKKSISGVEFNNAELITLDDGISIPADIQSGATLTVTITNTSGAKLASDLTITY